MPHSKPHATLFSSDELVEPSKIGNHGVSDKELKVRWSSSFVGQWNSFCNVTGSRVCKRRK